MNIREYFEKETGLPVAEVAFTKPQKLPFIIILDRTEEDGDDYHAQIISHELTVELYAARIDRESESKIEAALEKQAWKATRDREWIAEEKMFETIYNIKFTEKR